MIDPVGAIKVDRDEVSERLSRLSEEMKQRQQQLVTVRGQLLRGRENIRYETENREKRQSQRSKVLDELKQQEEELDILKKRLMSLEAEAVLCSTTGNLEKEKVRQYQAILNELQAGSDVGKFVALTEVYSFYSR